MSYTGRNNLKAILGNNQPLSANSFAQLIDAGLNFADDGIVKPEPNSSVPLQILSWGEEGNLLKLTNRDTSTSWQLNQRLNLENGLNISYEGTSKLFIEQTSGTVILKGLQLGSGNVVDAVSDDDDLGDSNHSANIIPTQRAVKRYVDNKINNANLDPNSYSDQLVSNYLSNPQQSKVINNISHINVISAITSINQLGLLNADKVIIGLAATLPDPAMLKSRQLELYGDETTGTLKAQWKKSNGTVVNLALADSSGLYSDAKVFATLAAPGDLKLGISSVPIAEDNLIPGQLNLSAGSANAPLVARYKSNTGNGQTVTAKLAALNTEPEFKKVFTTNGIYPTTHLMGNLGEENSRFANLYAANGWFSSITLNGTDIGVKGDSNGFCELDAAAKIPAERIPSDMRLTGLTRVAVSNMVPAEADLNNNEIAFYVDELAGQVKAIWKKSNGSVISNLMVA